MENFLPYPNDQYGQGIELDSYNGEISLVSAREKDGTIYKEWVAPIRNKKPIDKSLGFLLRIGATHSL